jgi:hypothetical protein
MISSPALPRTVAAPVPIPLREWLPWAYLAGLLLLFLLYVVVGEQGATAVIGGQAVHEWMHDSRHLLAFPCH